MVRGLQTILIFIAVAIVSTGCGRKKFTKQLVEAVRDCSNRTLGAVRLRVTKNQGNFRLEITATDVASAGGINVRGAIASNVDSIDIIGNKLMRVGDKLYTGDIPPDVLANYPDVVIARNNGDTTPLLSQNSAGAIVCVIPTEDNTVNSTNP